MSGTASDRSAEGAKTVTVEFRCSLFLRSGRPRMQGSTGNNDRSLNNPHTRTEKTLVNYLSVVFISL